ncbi:MAG: hypothetical protein VXY89_14080, partial [SAR324 cluster bacterium]|nr:hypothetical protein [SAR324 cluster bacterium]
LWTLQNQYGFSFGFSVDNMRPYQRLNELHQCHGVAAHNPSDNADLTAPLHKRSQFIASCVGAGWKHQHAASNDPWRDPWMQIPCDCYFKKQYHSRQVFCADQMNA